MNRNSVILFIAQFIVLVVLICFVAHLPAVEQFNLGQCQQLQEELEQTRRKQRNGYRLRDAEKIKESEQRLQKQLFYHCEKPIVTQSKSTVRRFLPNARPKPFELTRSKADEFFASTIEVKAPYQGKQLSAWLGYYQEPRFCYGVRTTSVIVECATRRQQAMQQFEQEWHQRQVNLSDQR
jgi:hypothetical protein